jgi:protein-S-isoprenylcysteine O-methyltransferase Ste14
MKILYSLPLIGFFIFCVLIILKVAHLKKDGIRVRSTNGIIMRIVLYPIFSLLLGNYIFEISRSFFENIPAILPQSISTPVFNSQLLTAIGSGIIVFACIFFYLSLKHFNTSLRFGKPSNNLGKLIRTGVFGISRNPFFISIELYFTGTALSIPSPLLIGFALFSILSIHFFILKEEKFMHKYYGQEYEDYCKKVRRYF